MASEQPVRTFCAPLDGGINTIGDLWLYVVNSSCAGDPVAKELVKDWVSLKNQSQAIVNKFCEKE